MTKEKKASGMEDEWYERILDEFISQVEGDTGYSFNDIPRLSENSAGLPGLSG